MPFWNKVKSIDSEYIYQSKQNADRSFLYILQNRDLNIVDSEILNAFDG